MGGIEHVIFDLDEVFVSLVDRVEEVTHKKAVWEDGRYSLDDAIGIARNKLWGKYCYTHAFWATLPPHPWMEQLIHYVEDHGCTWSVVTLPTEESWYSASGKLEWIRRNLGMSFKNYSITAERWRLSQDRTLLVDDYEENCREFEAAGKGRAITFAQPWNSKRDRVDKPGRLIDFMESFDRVNQEEMEKW